MVNAKALASPPCSEHCPHAVERIRLRFPSVLGYEKLARSAVARVAERMAFAPDRIEDIKTAVAEACLNAIEHGNRFRDDVPVRVDMDIWADRLTVMVSDSGQHGGAPVVRTRPDMGQSTRGWGMFFIQRLVDRLECGTLPEGGSQVKMTMFKSPKPDTGQEGPHPAADRALRPVESLPKTIQSAAEQPRAIRPADKPPRAIAPLADPLRALQVFADPPSALQIMPD